MPISNDAADMSERCFMKRSICVVCGYLSAEQTAMIERTAENSGFSAGFFRNAGEAAKSAADAEIVFTNDPALAEKTLKMKWCADYNAGVEAMLVPGVLPEGCILTKGSGAYGVTISEHIIMVTLMLMKRMPEYQALMRDREWRGGLPVRSVFGSRITILGTGDIGRNTARRFRAFSPEKITGICRSGLSEEAAFDEVYRTDRIDSILRGTDILIMCLPDTSETEGILSKDRMAVLPENALIVNVGRGSAIDQDALVDALNAGRIAGAALDVMTPEPLPGDDPLWEAKNCILTPHISGDMMLPHTVQRCVEDFCENIARYAAGEPVSNAVDIRIGY